MEYKTKYFDGEFFEGVSGDKGGDRIRVSPEGLGIVRGVVQVLSQAFHGKSFLDVGCGVGWFVKFLKERGEEAHGVELSPYAVERAVTEDIIQGDIRDLSLIDEKYDVVFAWNVMAYLDLPGISKAVSSLKKVSKGYIVFGIVTAEVLKAMPHGKPGRLTIKPWKWWIGRFAKLGLVQDYEKAAEMNKLGGGHWNIFCLKG